MGGQIINLTEKKDKWFKMYTTEQLERLEYWGKCNKLSNELEIVNEALAISVCSSLKRYGYKNPSSTAIAIHIKELKDRAMKEDKE